MISIDFDLQGLRYGEMGSHRYHARDGKPLDFIVVLEYISKLTRRAIELKQLETYKMGEVEEQDHLAFTNNVVFFTRENFKTLCALNTILHDFTMLSDLEVNCLNFFIIYLSRVQEYATLGEVLGSPTRHLPTMHIGIPVIGRTICHQDFEYLIGRLQSFISRRNGKKLFYNR